MAELSLTREMSRKRTSKRGLAFAIVLAVLAAAGTYRYLASQRAVTVEPPPPPPPMTEVIVAAVDIPAMTVVTAEMVAVRSIPAEAVHPGAILSQQDAIGQVARYPIVAGEPLLKPRLAGQGAPLGLTGVIPDGMRAVSVGVTNVVGTAGLIKPGDDVDVIAAFDDDEAGVDAAVIVLQDVRVLAVQTAIGKDGEEVSQDADKPAANPLSRLLPQEEEQTVTLAVTPEQAQALVLADTQGVLRLALRPFSDQSVHQLDPITLGELIPLRR